VTVYPTQPSRLPATARGDWPDPITGDQVPEDRNRIGTAVAFVVLLALAVLCVAAFLIVRAVSPESLLIALPPLASEPSSPPPGSPAVLPSAVPGQATIAVDPQQGTINTLVTAIGQGWSPGEPVFVFLRSPEEGEGKRYSYAAAVADDSGSFRTAFTFPNEARWIGQAWAEVIARGTRSGLEVRTRFTLLTPTPTNTNPLPTFPPTSPPTHTPQPTATLPPTPTPPAVITDWQGEYFADAALAGTPAIVRNDVSIDFDWGEGSPANGLPADGFSARWSRQYQFLRGQYRFTVAADDGVRFWVDGQLYVDEWHDGPFTAYPFDLDLNKGEHSLVLEYYEGVGQARVLLTWTRFTPPTATPAPTDTPAPTAAPAPTATPTATSAPTQSPPIVIGPWRAEYYANAKLEGPPSLTREEPQLAFEWGTGSPGEGVPEDHFSARWTGNVWVPAGTYQVSLDVDDGVRLWVDESLLIDKWYASGGAAYSTQVWLAEGTYRLRIEYFEDTLDAHAHASIVAVSN